MLKQTTLNGREITYTLKRCKRKSIGLKIDHQGLSINAPTQTALSHIDTILQEKAGWITKKLNQWQAKKSLTLSWAHDAVYPLLNESWHIVLNSSGEIAMARHDANKAGNVASTGKSITRLNLRQIEKFVMSWYMEQAIICFKERIAIYAQALNVPLPSFRLSNAKTRWGSCNTQGTIHLNWRLVQMPLHLIDYVVAHELSHLIEMNHSAAFWKQVESVYPDYLMARMALKEYG
jgi:predicted metal-dependent hydrolase